MEIMHFHIVHTNLFFEDIFVSHSGGLNEQFDTHEKLSLGARKPNLDAGVFFFVP